MVNCGIRDRCIVVLVNFVYYSLIQGQMLIEFLPDCTEYRGTSKVYFANLVSVTQILDITMA